MFEPPSETVYLMEMMDHMGPDSLDAIATRVYGRTYVGQQTGEMIGNDTYVRYVMSEDQVSYLNSLMTKEPKSTYIGYDYAKREGIYAEGVNAFEYWLALPLGDHDDIDAVRAAPEPSFVLADLISKGELPYGTYLMHVWW